MKSKRVEEIIEKFEKAKATRERNIGGMENIKKTWKNKYNVASKSEAEAELKRLDKEQQKIDDEMKELKEELEGLADWDSL